MPRKLIYSDDAIEDLKAIKRWQTQPGSGAAGMRRFRAVGAAIKRLRRHPCLHPTGQHAGVREMPCDGGYRALYRLHPDTGHDDTSGDVRLLRVFGPGQDRSSL